MQGESIAPTTDKTMKVIGIGSGGRSSIDPTDYMGNAFVYTEWVKKRQAEITSEQQKKQAQSIAGQERSNVQSQLATIKPQVEKNISETESDQKSIQETPEYKKFVEDQTKAKEKYLTELRQTPNLPTAGAIPVMHFAIDKYNKDVSDAKTEMQNATDALSKVTTAAELKIAKDNLEKATTKYHEVSNINPASTEGKEKYKDTMDVEYVEGPKYATGFGLGGFVGFGPGGGTNVANADQMAANVLGVKVGSALPQMQMTQQEILSSQGFKMETNPVTGGTGYFKTNADGTKTEFTGTFAPQRTGATFYIPGISQMKTAPGVGVTSDVLKDMMFKITSAGGKLTPGQAEDISSALITQNQATKQDTLNQLLTQYRINPTAENASAYNTFANKAAQTSGSDAARIRAVVEGYTKGVSGATTMTPTGPRVGSIGGTDIFGSKTTGEFISGLGGKPVALAEITASRQVAGKTGEFNVYNFPAAGGARAQDLAAAQARSFLYQNVPGAPIKEERDVRTGSVDVDGTKLDIIHKADRGEYVKLNTGIEVPLAVVTNLKELSSGTGIYAKSPDLQKAELDYLTAYKLNALNDDSESNTNLAIATQNLSMRNDVTQNILDNLLTMQNVGGKFAGVTYDTTKDKYVPADTNISKALLTFSAATPIQNAVKVGVLPPEAASYKHYSDIATNIQSHGGDPIIGVIKATRVLADNPYIYDMKPGTPSYNETIDAVSRIAASGNVMQGEYTLPKNVYTTTVPKLTSQDTSGFKKADENLNPLSIAIASPRSYGVPGATITKGNTSVNNPTIVKDTSKVYVNTTKFNNMFTKGNALKLAAPSVFGTTNVTGLQFRKSKGAKPKVNLKKKRAAVLVSREVKSTPSFDLDKIMGNISGIFSISNKSNKVIQEITMKPLSSVLFSNDKKKKK